MNTDIAPKGGWKLGKDSLSKMIVWFADGNIRTMYSIDWKNRFRPRDKEIGIARFKSKISEYGVKVRNAEIYDKSTGVLLFKFRGGIQIGHH
jgi:hypothetical protein